MEMVDSWCNGAEDGKIGSIQSILRTFRKACHYGEDQGDNSDTFSVMYGSVLNKVVHFVLKHMDRILGELLGALSFGGKKEAMSMLMIAKSWKEHVTFCIALMFVYRVFHLPKFACTNNRLYCIPGLEDVVQVQCPLFHLCSFETCAFG
ncbi:hypothetical protein PR202_ga07444 [Eleusine coracana subsp. coracana]|uniref:Uncharacterized protein n=1 Tax=Eleusine coracana subsp. coracana TaxID=191504 RepID=A0AAV5BY25_ELECO|nr:hypothetical protein PR202_ga07444 [Eleusine coracana subsp. coracana]